ncbi:MAG: hypothetical protein KY447_09755, partial [Actinobacteria bacterium]|nr:hypothetical protein [Actinomycetota bacterium]
MTRLGLPRSRRRLLLAMVAGVALVVASAGVRSLLYKPTAVPLLLPVYEIEAVSKKADGTTHRASLGNLNLGQPGAPQAPVPVDVNGDLVPDVTVAVNLMNVEGVFQDPLVLDGATMVGRVVAPNIQIDRALTPGVPVGSVPLLPPGSPPLRINVKLTVTDAAMVEPDTYFRFGYDTGDGGSIPGTFKGVVNGVDRFFNPLEAVIDTKGGYFGVNTVPSFYEGPLTIVAGVQQGPDADPVFRAAADLVYRPFPDTVRVQYSSDDQGQHLAYSHAVGTEVDPRYSTYDPASGEDRPYVPGDIPEVDLITALHVLDKRRKTSLDITSRVDRLPRAINVDYFTDDDAGRVDYLAKADGRLPDVSVDLRSAVDGAVTNGRFAIEALPPELHALWSTAESGASALVTTSAADLTAASGGTKPCPMPPAREKNKDKVDPPPCRRPPVTSAEGPGIGAVELRVANFDDKTKRSGLTDFVPREQQYLSYQSATVGADQSEQIISGRVERIRRVQFNERNDGFDAGLRIGDGALPLQLHVDTDALPAGDHLRADSTLSPLPSAVDVSLRNGSKDDLGNPLKLIYDASQSIDVDTDVEVRKPAARGDDCGQPLTTCAKVAVRHLPPHLETRIAEQGEGVGAESRIEVDAVRAPGGAHPDVVVDAVLGKTDGSVDPAIPEDDPVPLVVHGELLGIPDHVRVRTVEGADETLESIDFHGCVVIDHDLGNCQPGTAGKVGVVALEAKNFLEKRRPTGLPPPAATAPNFATITGRGVEGSTQTVRFEAAARVEQIGQVSYLNDEGFFGLRTSAGGGKDLQALVDLRDIDFEGDSPDNGRVDIIGSALVTPLPETVDLCLRKPDKPMLTSPAPFTDPCETVDPFGDGPLTRAPLTFAYRAASGFSSKGSFDVTAHGKPGTVADDHTNVARFDLRNVPSQLTANVQAPAKGVVGPTRVLAVAPGASNFDVSFASEDRRGGADCDDPRPAGDVSCVSVDLDDLPTHLSVLTDPTKDRSKVELHACDWSFRAATPGCRTGTEGQVGAAEVAFRSVKGAADPLPLLPTPGADQYALVQMDQNPNDPEDPDDDDVALRAHGRVEGIRHVQFAQSADGFDVHTDLGDGIKPLEADVHVDTRSGTGATATGSLIKGRTVVNPLPSDITFTQHGPGTDQRTAPMLLTYRHTAPGAVTVDASAELFKAGGGAACGERLSVCATAHLDRLPQSLTARLARISHKHDPQGLRVDRALEFDLDAAPAPGLAPPDLVVDATLGEGLVELPTLLGGAVVPLVARAELLGFPRFVRLRTDEHEQARMVSVGTATEREVVASDLERAELHTCNRDFTANTCAAGTEGPDDQLGTLRVNLRNFLIRPVGFAPPEVVTEPNHALVNIAGGAFEAAVQMRAIREAQFVNRAGDGIVGVRTRIGDGQPLRIKGNVSGLPIGTVNLGDLQVSEAVADVAASASVTPLPAEFNVCFRRGGQGFGTPTGSFTDPCEDLDPFGDQSARHTPLSVAYRASTNFNVESSLGVVLNGTEAGTTNSIAPRRINGRVDVDDLPAHLTLHV